MAQLRLINKDGDTRNISLSQGKVVIGRHPTCQVILSDPRASRQHAELHRLDGGGWLARDLGSRNRTYLNEIPLEEDRELSSGDVIRVGQTKMEFVDADSDASSDLAQLINNDRRIPADTLAQKPPKQITLSIDEIRRLCARSTQMATGLDENELLKILLDQLVSTLNADRGFVAMRPQRSDPLLLRAEYHLPSPDRINKLQFISRSIVHTALLQGQMVLYPDPAVKREPGALVEGGIATSMCVPIQVNRQNMGVIYVDRLGKTYGFTGSELSTLMATATQIAAAIENLEDARNESMQREAQSRLQVLRVLQNSARPAPPAAIGELTVASFSLAGTESVSDFHDFMQHGSQMLLFALGDLGSGGVPATMNLTAMLASIRTSVQYAGQDTVDIGSIFNSLNVQVAGRATGQSTITLFAGAFDLQQRRFHYVNAGIPMPLMINEQRQLIQLEQNQLLLGVDPTARYQQTTIKLPRRYRLVVCSDGLIEATNSKDDTFDHRRLGELLLKNEKKSVSEIADAANAEITSFTKNRSIPDDLTIIVFGER